MVLLQSLNLAHSQQMERVQLPHILAIQDTIGMEVVTCVLASRVASGVEKWQPVCVSCNIATPCILSFDICDLLLLCSFKHYSTE